MSPPLFKPPTRSWGWALYPIVAALLATNIVFLILHIQDGSSKGRVEFAICFSLMVISLYLLFGYHYLRWAASRKAELHRIAKKNPKVLFEKYNRVFIDDEVCNKQGVDPLRFKRLRQVDLREVVQKLSRN
ncbi:hypothetical protein M5X11_13015 [Paenibacillus alginolyticus]|uniref:hypothetical protein n=1 Tax=Paenibacillus alginolyticus TaxID=59839 RepID=UPI00040BF710|nr:hypothetical protein [Paenibacillus alginolyticus]MCY9665876.1 hypothetical protein [Paenibacillus alginolyticus]